MIPEQHFAVLLGRPHDTSPALARHEVREAQRRTLGAIDSARASKDWSAFSAKLQEIGRVSRYRLLEEEGRDLHRRRFLAWVAIAVMGTQVVQVLEVEIACEQKTGPTELPAPQTHRVAGRSHMAAPNGNQPASVLAAHNSESQARIA